MKNKEKQTENWTEIEKRRAVFKCIHLGEEKKKAKKFEETMSKTLPNLLKCFNMRICKAQ
jgi:hypothetical protein